MYIAWQLDQMYPKMVDHAKKADNLSEPHHIDNKNMEKEKFASKKLRSTENVVFHSTGPTYLKLYII